MELLFLKFLSNRLIESINLNSIIYDQTSIQAYMTVGGLLYTYIPYPNAEKHQHLTFNNIPKLLDIFPAL